MDILPDGQFSQPDLIIESRFSQTHHFPQTNGPPRQCFPPSPSPRLQRHFYVASLSRNTAPSAGVFSLYFFLSRKQTLVWSVDVNHIFMDTKQNFFSLCLTDTHTHTKLETTIRQGHHYADVIIMIAITLVCGPLSVGLYVCIKASHVFTAISFLQVTDKGESKVWQTSPGAEKLYYTRRGYTTDSLYTSLLNSTNTPEYWRHNRQPLKQEAQYEVGSARVADDVAVSTTAAARILTECKRLKDHTAFHGGVQKE